MAAIDGWRRRVLVPVLIFVGLVVAAISSLGAPLIPTVAIDEHVSLSSAQWTLTVTLLVGAVATPAMGRLGDGARRRGVILASLAVVFAGCVLSALPTDFAFLMAGRALQGVGLGLVPLAIATARDNLPREPARSAISLLSITTAAGLGLGYPLTGLITDSFDLHAAYWFGAAVSGLALVCAAAVVPPSIGRAGRRLDVLGAVLLGLALTALLLALTQAPSWGWFSTGALGLGTASLLLALAWAWHELRTPHPLVDLGLARQRAVLFANLTMAFAGVGVYLLLSLMTRFVQTPVSTGYGFGSSVVVAGLVLLPFSAMSLLAGRLTPLLTNRMRPERVLALSCAVFVLATLSFAIARGRLWESFVTMGIAGLGVGLAFSVIPLVIVRGVPVHETGSAMSFNQVVRTVGFTAGSALSAVVLKAYTPDGATFPSGAGYGAAAWTGVAVLAVTLVASVVAGGTPVARRDYSASSSSATTGR